jgi:hypothetical protein
VLSGSQKGVQADRDHNRVFGWFRRKERDTQNGWKCAVKYRPEVSRKDKEKERKGKSADWWGD